MKHLLVWGLIALAVAMLVLASDAVAQDAVIFLAGLAAFAVAWKAMEIPGKAGLVASGVVGGLLIGIVVGLVRDSLESGITWGASAGIFMAAVTAWLRQLRQQQQER